MYEYPRKSFERYPVSYFLELFPHPNFSVFYFMLYVFKLLKTNKHKQEVITILVPKCLVWHLMQGLNCRLERQKLELKTRMWCAGVIWIQEECLYFPKGLTNKSQALTVTTNTF